MTELALAHYELAVKETADRIAESRASLTRPIIAAIDGRSGVGKSTFAKQLGGTTGATVIDGDDFYAGGVGLAGDAPEARSARCIDWRRQRDVLGALRIGRAANYHAFDWEAFDGRLSPALTEIGPANVIILEGVYSGRPELSDLLDLRILLRAPDDVRLARLLAREGTIGSWERQWHEAEDWYFGHLAKPDVFDLVIDTH
jgi:uridine kinase